MQHISEIEGQWVFGGTRRQTKACFLVPVGQRDKDTLSPIIRAHILPGARVMGDMSKTYDCIKDEGYTQLTVNRSLNFLDPDAGAHSQRIENTRWGVKQSMPRTGTGGFRKRSSTENGLLGRRNCRV